MAIADAILSQIEQAGQPRTIRSTETVTGREPLDIGGLGLLLYMLMEGMGPGGPNEPPLGGDVLGGLLGPGLSPPPAPAGLNIPQSPLSPPGLPGPAGGNIPGQLRGSSFAGMDPMQMIMRILGSLGAARPGARPGGF